MRGETLCRGAGQLALEDVAAATQHKLRLVAACVQELGEDTIAEVLGSLQYATEAAPGWAKAWHNWALFNVQVSAAL